jgi:hypothetical protein
MQRQISLATNHNLILSQFLSSFSFKKNPSLNSMESRKNYLLIKATTPPKDIESFVIF